MSVDDDLAATVTFDATHVAPILEGEKWSTIRYDDVDELEQGDRFRLAKENGDGFANATVDRLEPTTPDDAVEQAPEGHSTYASVDAFLDEFSGYYPDGEIEPSTDLTAVVLDRESIEPFVPVVDGAHHKARRALAYLWGRRDDAAIRIESTPEYMYVTVEDGDLAFWSFNYTWRCFETKPIEDVFGKFESVVDELHGLARSDYPISTAPRGEIDDERKPRASTLDAYTPGDRP